MSDTSSAIEQTNLADYEQIYRIDGGGKTYVGRTAALRGIDVRFQEHVGTARAKKTNKCSKLLVEAMIALGPNSFGISEIELVEKTRATTREIFWINELNTVAPNGYNLTGGSGDKYELHAETKALLRCNGEERRNPRARKNADAQGNSISQPGVKSLTRKDGSVHYRSYHPTNTTLVSCTFDDYEEAVEYAKKLMSFDDEDIPEEYLVERKPTRACDLKYIKGPKPHAKGTSTVAKGTLVGYEVDVPAESSKDGQPHRKGFLTTKNSLADNLTLATQFRDLHIKADLLK